MRPGMERREWSRHFGSMYNEGNGAWSSLRLPNPEKYLLRTSRMGLKQVSVAILGTRGIPAMYGGFETFAEQIAIRLVKRGVAVTVFCESNGGPQISEYEGVRLEYVKSPKIGPLSTIAFDLACLWRARRG